MPLVSTEGVVAHSYEAVITWCRRRLLVPAITIQFLDITRLQEFGKLIGVDDLRDGIDVHLADLIYFQFILSRLDHLFPWAGLCLLG